MVADKYEDADQNDPFTSPDQCDTRDTKNFFNQPFVMFTTQTTLAGHLISSTLPLVDLCLLSFFDLTLRLKTLSQ